LPRWTVAPVQSIGAAAAHTTQSSVHVYVGVCGCIHHPGEISIGCSIPRKPLLQLSQGCPFHLIKQTVPRWEDIHVYIHRIDKTGCWPCSLYCRPPQVLWVGVRDCTYVPSLVGAVVPRWDCNSPITTISRYRHVWISSSSSASSLSPSIPLSHSKFPPSSLLSGPEWFTR
jgi:hypothetical protein